MDMLFDIFLYGTGFSGIDTSSTANDESVQFYMIFQNPLDINDYYESVDAGNDPADVYYDDWIPYDGVLATLQIKET